MDVRIGILTISDRAAWGEREDTSGLGLEIAARELGWKVTLKAVIPDEFEDIKNVLLDWARSGQVDVILTTGGTGFGPRDITPEATLEVIQREAPGLAEAMRSASLKVTPHGMLSRAVTGIRDKTLIINLPGSPKGALENLETIGSAIPHAVQLLRGDPASEAGHKAVSP